MRIRRIARVLESTMNTAVWIVILIGSLALCGILIYHEYVMSGGFAAWKARRAYRRAGSPSTFVDDGC